MSRNHFINFVSAEEAAKLIPDNAVIASACFGNGGWPHELAYAMEDRFLETGHPANITHIHAAGCGDFGKNGHGECHWSHEGMMTRVITSHPGSSPKLMDMIAKNKIAAWNQPLGTMLQVFREMGRNMPGLLSKTGLGTFMDPRKDNGAINELARSSGESWMDYVPDFRGEDYIFYKAYPLTHALLRGTYADTNGNISIIHEAYNLESLAVAQAVKACGGKVFVQVQKVVELGQIHPKMVKIPGIYVDYVVEAQKPELDWMTQGTYYDPTFSGELRVDTDESVGDIPLSPDKVMVRRAAMEIRPGFKCNFGIGKPQLTGSIIEEEKCRDLVVMISESGAIGGVPGSGLDFGAHKNIEISCDQGDHFSFFDGGGLDLGVFGLSEADKDGNINTSLLNGKVKGVGGFANIAATAKHAIFLGTFTAGDIKCHVEDGKMVIDHEGEYAKFVGQCPQLTFYAEESLKKGNTILFITERCVIKRTWDGLVLEEIAPGIDMQTQIIDLIPEVKLIIPEGGPKLMDPAIFQEKWGGLRDIVTKDYE
jgi:propionate CoA-transferase